MKNNYRSNEFLYIPVSLTEIKEKLKSQLKELLDVDGFKIITAQHKDTTRLVVMEYQKSEKSPTGTVQFYKTQTSDMAVNDRTG